MSVSPQPARPPVDPAPPRSGSHLLLIALLVLALILVVSAATVWFGVQFLARGVKVNVDKGGAGAEQVSIKTPIGSLEVAKDVDKERIGLPIYPGATKADDDSSASVDFDFGDEANLRVLAVKLETADAIERVRDFYINRLGDEVTKFVDRDHEGKTVFEIKTKGQEKIVALRQNGPGTQIELVRLTHGPRETN